ncbi:enoyl-CoA hydratase/isomerase family protein [Limobrevibacterium gyesilva]|uniref:Enoyl-CoA hydratase-related protein n=1 Tax=Limobrevibacterium gyesilva TaxID=2991712 RepID=A0AA41YQX9_9PROT|nr:enoyl-CoA hydratase-related protein [Limobrevibacterium gyesilva]MCW3477225.1 enoyl-CoA hydratase-related protein [Limobrevibacterium gyesilva]
MSILLRDDRDGVSILTLNRPEIHNAISTAVGEALEAALRDISGRPEIRVVIIKGAGGKAFSAGTDLKERRGLSPKEKWEQSSSLRRANEVMWNMPQPAIAAIEGWCLGGGFELACNCDLKIAADDAVFAWPEMQLGAYPGGTAGVIFPRLIGRGRAKELFFTARRITAQEALEFGIVERVVPKQQLHDAALGLAEEIKINSSPLGVAAVKRMVNVGADMSIGDATALNDALRRPLEATKDYEEGIRAFFEKRRPVWRGE